MNHPNQEEWMSYLYDELPPAQREPLTSHLNACADCQAAVRQWRGVMRELDAGELPRRARPVAPWGNQLKWGVAAMLMLGLGLGLGRSLAPAPVDVTALRRDIEHSLKASLQADLRQQLLNGVDQRAAQSAAATQRLVDKLEETVKTARESDQQSIVALLKEMEAQRLTDYTALRKDLETVALAAEEQLGYAQQQIGQLASYTASGTSTGAPKN